MANKIANQIKKLFSSQLAIPLVALIVLVVFNLIRDPSFFSIVIKKNNLGNTVLSGNLISILNGASELVILAIGMTLVTSATKGQDISIGAAAAIAGSVFVKILRAGSINAGTMILFTAGRPIAYWINGGATPNVESPLLTYIGGFIPHIAIPTPIIVVVVFILLINLLLKKTTLGLYIQAVGINERAAKLNGINPVIWKLAVFVILGVCVTMAGSINVCRIGLINHETILLDIEMDAILAVAIGGNSLGGGKFKLSGSILGAYIIQALTITLYAMKVSSTAVKAYKAIVIIIIVIAGSPVVKAWLGQLKDKIVAKKEAK